MSGVYPVHNNTFEINVQGRTSPGSFVEIADMETFELAIQSKTDEWTPIDLEGWIRRAVTGKGLSVKLKGKRNYGDTGNDYVAGKILATGQDCESAVKWTLPDNSILQMNCIIDLKQPAGGESTKIDSLEVELLSDGLPTFVPGTGTLGLLTFVCVDSATAGATKISSVSPVCGGSNSYMYKVNGDLPAYDEVLNAAGGWAAYVLDGDIPVVDNNDICLVEVVTATGKAQKGGTAAAVVS